MNMERLKERIQPKGRNQRNKYKSELDHFRQTTESFSEFWTELKRKFELARNKSTRCNAHQNCNACLDGYKEEELMSLIFSRVKDQRIRDCIDMLPDAEHTLEEVPTPGRDPRALRGQCRSLQCKRSDYSLCNALRYPKNKGKGTEKSSGKLCTY